MLSDQCDSALSEEIVLQDLNLRDGMSTTRSPPKTLTGHIGLRQRRNRRGSHSSKSHADSRVLLLEVEHPQNVDEASVPLNRPVTSQHSRGTMRDALRSPAHRRAPELETPTEPAPFAGAKLHKSATTLCPNHRVVHSLRKSNTLPSLRLEIAPLDKKMLPLPRRLLELRPLPAPVHNGVAPLATSCEQGSANRESVVRPGSTARGQIDLSPTAHTHAGSDARAGAVERFRRMTEQDSGDTGLEKDKRELLSLFASGRDTGFILDVTEGDIASPTGAALTSLRLPVPRAEMTQGHPAAPVPGPARRRFAIDGGSSKHLKKLKAAKRDEEQLLEALSEKALVEAAHLEKDKSDLLLLFASGRDAGFILDVSGSSPAPVPVTWCAAM